MIFTEQGDKLFFLDILLHLLFSYTILMMIFIIKFRRTKQKELESKIDDVLKTNVIDEVTSPDATDITNLKILDSIYTNRDNFDKVTNNDIKKSSYNQVLIFTLAIFVVVFYLEDKSNLLSLLIDKIITFVILGSTIYLYCTYFRQKYSEIKEKKIYDILRDANSDLKSSTTY